MPSSKISALPPASAVTGAEKFPVVQAGQTRFSLLSAVLAYVQDNLGSASAADVSAFLAAASRGAANGVASLGSDGKVPANQMPAIALVNVYQVADEAAQLALVAQAGDVAVRTDEHKSYMHNGGAVGDMTDWIYLENPLGADGFTNPMDAGGDIIVASTGGVPGKLAIGEPLQLLRVNAVGSTLEYADPSALAPLPGTTEGEFLLSDGASGAMVASNGAPLLKYDVDAMLMLLIGALTIDPTTTTLLRDGFHLKLLPSAPAGAPEVGNVWLTTAGLYYCVVAGVAIGPLGSVTPAGPSGAIQFNEDGVLAGTAEVSIEPTAGAVTVSGRAGETGLSGGGVYALGGLAGAGGTGGAIHAYAGDGGLNGGTVTIKGGDTSDASGTPGAVDIKGGDAYGGGSFANNVSLRSGHSLGTGGTGGHLLLSSGGGTEQNGSVFVTAGKESTATTTAGKVFVAATDAAGLLKQIAEFGVGLVKIFGTLEIPDPSKIIVQNIEGPASDAINMYGETYLHPYPGAGDSNIRMNKTENGQASTVWGMHDDSARWGVHVADAAAESSGNVGSDFAISRWSDAGSFLSYVLSIARASGLMTLRGDMTVTNPGSGGVNLTLNKTANSVGNVIWGQRDGVARWEMHFGDNTAESTANAGSDIWLYRRSDAGAFIDAVYSIRRNSGVLTHRRGTSHNPLKPAFSATPTFDANAGDLFVPGVLTANVTSMTIINPDEGQFLTFRVKQDGTGGRTHAVPAGSKVNGSIGTVANQVSILTLLYNLADARYEGSWNVIPV